MKKVSRKVKVVAGIVMYPIALGTKLLNTVWKSTVDLAFLPLTAISDTIDTVNKSAEEMENESINKDKKED